MRIIGNLLWWLFGGLEAAIGYFTGSLAMAITIIGIPFGYQLFKMAGFALWPFGREVVSNANDNGCLAIFMNVIWILVGGIEIAMMHITAGVVFCITIIGIPFGLQHFKMAFMALIPFGKEIVPSTK